MTLAPFNYFAGARVGAEQAEEVRPRAHGRAVFLDEMAGFATDLRESFLAERDEILEILFIGLAARGLGHGQLFEVGGFVARVAQREGAGLAHEEERGTPAVLVIPVRT